MKIKTGQGNMTLQKLIAIYSISMVTSLPGLAISPILGKLESIFSSTSELQLQMLESLPSFIIVPFILLAGRISIQKNYCLPVWRYLPPVVSPILSPIGCGHCC